MKLTPHEEKVLALIKQHPEIVEDHQAREKIAQKHGYTEKTLRNRIGDLKKYGVIEFEKIAKEENKDDSSILKLEVGQKPSQSENRSLLLSSIGVLNTLLKYQKLVLIFMVSVGILTSALMLIVPKTYKSYALIYPTSNNSNDFGILGMISGIAGGVGAQSQNETGFILSILHSRQLLESVADKFELMDIYDVEFYQELIDRLQDDFNVEVTDEGAINISFACETKWVSDDEADLLVKVRSQDILNYIVDFLDETNVSLKTQNARFQREFLEKRFFESLETLKYLEDAVVQFERENGIISIENQINAKVDITTELMKRLIENEVLLYAAEKTLSASDPNILNLKIEAESINEQITSLDRSKVDTSIVGLLLPNFVDIPDLAIQDTHLKKELEAQIRIVEFIGQKLEEARLREAKDTPTIQVIDYPSLPELRSAPQRTITVIVTMIFAFILIMFIVYLIENINDAIKHDVEIRTENDILKQNLRKLYTQK